jgi:hypothetical protein
MITFQELRYGNKLIFLDKVVTFKNITNIRQDGVFWIDVLEDFIPQKSFHFKPIPLTEEWLLKFGFEKDESKDFMVNYHLKVNNDIFIQYEYDFSCALFADKKSSIDELGVLPRHTNSKYVHQLQNLYYALIGEELIIK